MSVQFDVSANTSAAKAALEQLKEKFKELNRQGEDFRKADLSRATGPLKDDMEIILKNWRDMSDPRIGGKRGERIRKQYGENAAPWDVDHRIYPNADPAELERHMQRLLENLLRGTQQRAGLPPMPAPPAPAGPAGGRSGSSGGGHGGEPPHESGWWNKTKQTVGAVSGGMKFGAGLFGLQTGIDALGNAVQGARDIDKNTDEFTRRTQAVGQDFGELRQRLTGVGQGLGLVIDESAQLALAFARTARTTSIEQTTAGAEAAIGLAHGFGADKAQTVQSMAHLSLLGAGGNGPITTRDKRLALLVGQAASQGGVPLEKAVGDLSRSAQEFSNATLRAPNAEVLTGMWQSVYQTATQKGNERPGLMGTGGESLMAAADAGFRQSGQNPVKDLLMFESLSPHMKTDNPFQILQQQQKGAFATIKNAQTGEDTGVTNAEAFIKTLEKRFGFMDPLATAQVMDANLGMGGIDRSLAFIDIAKNYRKNQDGTGGIKNFEQDLAKRGISLEKLQADAIGDLGPLLKDPTNLKLLDAKFQGAMPRMALSDEEKTRLEGLQTKAHGGDAGDVKNFSDELIKSIATHGATQTQFSVMEETLASIKSGQIDHVGRPIVEGISRIAAILEHEFGTTPEEIEKKQKLDNAEKAAKETAITGNEKLMAADAKLAQNPLGTPGYLAAMKAKQEEFDNQKAAYKEEYKQKKKAYGDTGFHILPPDQSKAEEELLERIGKHKGKHQSPIATEIDKHQAELDKLNPGFGGWFTSTPEKYQQKKDAYEARRAELEPTIKALQEMQEQYEAERQEKARTQEQAQEETDPKLRAPESYLKRAVGGSVPGGYGGGDKVPALLEPGEYVLRKEAVQQAGLSQVEQWNAARPIRRADGGTVPGGYYPFLSPPAQQGADPITVESSEAATAIRELQGHLDQLFTAPTQSLQEIAAILRGGNASTPGAGGGTVPSAASAGTGAGSSSTGSTGAGAGMSGGAAGEGFPGDGLGWLSPALAKKGAAGAAPSDAPPPDLTGKIPTSPAAASDMPPGLAGKIPSVDLAAPASAGQRQPSMGAGTSASGGAGSVGPVGTGTKALLNQISMGEGTTDANARKHGYASAYDTTLGYGRYGGKAGEGKPLSEMTVGEVKQLQKAMLAHPENKWNSSAVGKYQIVGSTLRGLQGQMGIKDNETFSPELQDRMATELLKQRGLDKFKKGKISESQFQENLAKEWASIAHPDTGKATQHTGTTSAQIQAAMAAAKEGEGSTTSTPVPAPDPTTPKPLPAAPAYAPLDDKPPIPAPPTQRMADTGPSSGGHGIASLDVTVRQEDAYGARTAADANHRINLRVARPHGAISVSALNSSRVA